MTSSGLKKLLLLGLLLTGLTAAQTVVLSKLVYSVQEVSVQFRKQIDSKQASVKWIGMGLVSGDMVDMELTNLTDQPLSFRLVPGMVLQDPGQEVQPILLEENLRFTLKGGETVKRRLRGYCLDYRKNPPARASEEDYQVRTDLAKYKDAIEIVYSGLRLEKRGKLRPVLRPLIHRTVVIQRAVWSVMGEGNPNSQAELVLDLEDELQYRSSIFPEGQTNCLSDRLWADVQQILKDSGVSSE